MADPDSGRLVGYSNVIPGQKSGSGKLQAPLTLASDSGRITAYFCTSISYGKVGSEIDWNVRLNDSGRRWGGPGSISGLRMG